MNKRIRESKEDRMAKSTLLAICGIIHNNPEFCLQQKKKGSIKKKQARKSGIKIHKS
jgi:hypothetical protein